ncbi:MAG: VTT domain-containing protein [Haloarculaceae archaeon]
MVSQATRRQVASLGALALAVGGAAVVFSPRTVFSSVADLSTRPWLFVAVVSVLFVVRPLVMWPVSVFAVTIGFVLGVEYGVPFAVAGTVVSNTIVFLLVRYARTDAGVVGHASRSGDRFVELTGELRGMVAARLAPVPADVVSSAAGLSEVSLGAYVLGTLVGETPWIVAEVIAGSSMHTLSVHGLSHSASLLVGASTLSVVLLARPVYRYVRERDGPPVAPP